MNYALIEKNVVVQVLRVDPAAVFAPSFAALFVACGAEVTVGWRWSGGAFVPPLMPAAAIPQKATRKQARKALALAGLFDAVQPAINAISDPLARRLAQIDWDDAQDYERSDHFLQAMAGALSLDDSALDALFVAASTL